MNIMNHNMNILRENQINFNEMLKSFIINSQINVFETAKSDEEIFIINS